MFRSINLVISMMLVIVSCTPQENKQRDPIKEVTTSPFMVPDFIEHQILDTSMISSVQLIPLQTNDKSILKKIDELELRKKHIYILDKEQECIFIFDKQGRFVNKIKKQGRGPEEYYCIVDFSIDEDNGIIDIYDHKKLVRYDLDGNFLNAVNVSFFANNFVTTDSGYIFSADNFCNNNFCDNVIYCDSEMRILSTELLIPDNLKNIQHSEGRRLLKSGGGQIRLVGYDDRIYTLSDSAIMHKEKVIVEGSLTPESFYEQRFTSLNDYVLKFLRNPNAGFIGNYNENSHYLSFNMHKDKFTYNYLFNKLTGMKVSFRKIESEILNHSIMSVYEDRLYSFFETTRLTEIQNDLSTLNEFDRNILKRNKKLLSTVKMSDNPIIITYKVN